MLLPKGVEYSTPPLPALEQFVITFLSLHTVLSAFIIFLAVPSIFKGLESTRLLTHDVFSTRNVYCRQNSQEMFKEMKQTDYGCFVFISEWWPCVWMLVPRKFASRGVFESPGRAGFVHGEGPPTEAVKTRTPPGSRGARLGPSLPAATAVGQRWSPLAAVGRR